MKTKLTLLTILTAAVFSASTMADDQQKKIDEITQMLQNNPEIVDSLHDSLNRYLEQQVALDQTIEDDFEYMYNNKDHAYFGAEEPKLTIINFTDYSCPWCKKLDPELEKLAEKYPNEIKVVNLYVPIKEMQSASNSASFALNVWENEPEKFAQAHEMLVAKPGVHNARSIERIAKKLDLEQYIPSDNKTNVMLKKNYQLFNQLGIRGTPGMLVNGQVIPGYMPLEKLEKLALEAIAKEESSNASSNVH